MDLDEAVTGIMAHRELVHKKDLWSNPSGLSEEMLKLSTYNAYLADNLAGLHRTATDTAHKLYTQNVANGVTNAQELSRGGSTEEREAYENAQNIYKSTSNLISVMQSRLRVIEGQMKREGEIT